MQVTLPGMTVLFDEVVELGDPLHADRGNRGRRGTDCTRQANPLSIEDRIDLVHSRIVPNSPGDLDAGAWGRV